jgi:nickel/cobalt transporter (NicO) family protein
MQGRYLLALCLCVCVVRSSFAHPVPRLSHDRVIAVHLTPDAVRVDYHLELDEFTAVYNDLPAVLDKAELNKLSGREFYDAFTRAYAPILADNLLAKLDGKPLTFTCARHGHQVKDSLQCDFVFEAPWKPNPGEKHAFTFRESNYHLETGQVQLSLVADAALGVLEKKEPDEEVKKRQATDLKPGDDARLRSASATFTLAPPPAEAAAPPTTPAEPPQPEATAPPETNAQPHSLLQLLLDSEQGFLMLLVLAAAFGAVHALTPGHGKTLVAAYLVGERGTVWHALLLGLVTTLTHTGAVLLLAAALPLLFPQAVPAQVQGVLGFVGGLLIAGMGVWLLLRRLSGQADHFHLPGTGHHHHHHHGHDHDHSHADHVHDEHGNVKPVAERGLGWWGLVVMGISGGIVPCWDAIAMLFFAISARRLWLGLPLLLAFSAGLAGVLIVIGVLVVSAKGFAQARFGESARLRRVFQLLPLFSAAAVLVLGLWLCRDSLMAPPP